LDTISALQVLTPYKLGLKIEGQVYNSKYPKGFIVSQDPEKGEKIRKNRDLKIIISKGTEMVPVPNLTGLPARHAKVLLQQVGLNKGDEAYINSGMFPQNRILSQGPPPGMLVKRGIKVNFLISLGPKKKKYLMPDFIGQRLPYLEKGINDAGLMIGEVTYEYSPGFQDGTIITQNPIFGMPIEAGEKIKFKITREEVFSDKNKLTRYAVLYYIPPIGVIKKNVRVVIEDIHEHTKEEVFSEQKASPGEKIQIVIGIAENDIARIYLDDELVEEKTF
ncbi:PASTA domain-containing protein, partial [Candidatus Desantisbacteria bacterium]|nr:PASTA domain-containing protein [Candidatus Desantisbacteria bacterium]